MLQANAVAIIFQTTQCPDFGAFIQQRLWLGWIHVTKRNTESDVACTKETSNRKNSAFVQYETVLFLSVIIDILLSDFGYLPSSGSTLKEKVIPYFHLDVF